MAPTTRAASTGPTVRPNLLQKRPDRLREDLPSEGPPMDETPG